MKSILTTSASRWLLPACLLLWIVPAVAQDLPTEPQVSYDVRRDVSPPLREMARNAPPLKRARGEMLEPKSSFVFPPAPTGEDTAAQEAYLPGVSTHAVLSFDGMTSKDSGDVAPPDTNGSVGSTQFVEIVNFAYAVFDKASGKLLLKPTSIDTIWQGFGGLCQNINGGDPVVLWDKIAQRWLVTQLSYNQGFTKDFVCIAVSTSADATGSFNRYAFNFQGQLPDYPKYGIWPDAYYFTANVNGAEPCAFDRKAMISGKKAAMICITPNPNYNSFLPSDMDGSTLPPAGAPNHYLDIPNSSANQLAEFNFHVDFADPKKSTFTGPNLITVPTYLFTCGGTGACIPQPSPGEALKGLSDRLMFRLAYRNFGDHESLVVSHVVLPGKHSTALGAMRWYELRSTPAGGKFSLYQVGTFQNPTTSLWMGSIAMDKQADIALGMSASSDTLKPSVWYTGRVPTDPLGKMETPVVAVKGTAVQVGDGQRWGDYSSMSIDPVDDCTFWYSQQYYNKKNGGASSGDWSTRITAFRFNGCK
jgi:hypothetical protein